MKMKSRLKLIAKDIRYKKKKLWIFILLVNTNKETTLTHTQRNTGRAVSYSIQ